MQRVQIKEFSNVAKSQFAFLERDFDFRLDSERAVGDSIQVKYCSSKVYVTISMIPPEFEPKISFGQMGIDDREGAFSFEQGDLTLRKQCHDWQWKEGKHSWATYISEYARILRECGADCLRGEDLAFAELRERRKLLTSQWVESELVHSARAVAEKAWMEKSFYEVANAYEQIYQHLTASEIKRFEYSKKQLSSK